MITRGSPGTRPLKASSGPHLTFPVAVGAATVLSSALTATLLLSAVVSRPTPCNRESGTQLKSKSRFHIDSYGVVGPVPWEHLNQATQKAFTLDGRIDCIPEYYKDQFVEGPKPLWDRETISQLVSNASSGGLVCPYGNDTYFYRAFKEYPLKGKSVLVVGSQRPWAEAFAIAFEAGSITTVDFNVLVSEDLRIRTISIAQLDATDETFDVAISYSSLEHDGLGRYGDPLNPNGDIERMRKVAALLKPGGILFLGLPNGPDLLVFNGHRIYGSIRSPMLIEGWDLLKTYASKPLEDIFKGPKNVWENQPLHTLRVKHASS